MSPIATGVLLILVAVAIDALRAGSRSWGDSAALALLTLGAFRVWAGSPASRQVEAWMLGTTASALDSAQVRASTADTRAIVTALVGLLAVFAILSIIPEHLVSGGALSMLTTRLSLAPRAGWRLNWKVYALGIPLGMLAPVADIPGTVVLVVGGLVGILPDFFAALGGGR